MRLSVLRVTSYVKRRVQPHCQLWQFRTDTCLRQACLCGSGMALIIRQEIACRLEHPVSNRQSQVTSVITPGNCPRSFRKIAKHKPRWLLHYEYSLNSYLPRFLNALCGRWMGGKPTCNLIKQRHPRLFMKGRWHSFFKLLKEIGQIVRQLPALLPKMI